LKVYFQSICLTSDHFYGGDSANLSERLQQTLHQSCDLPFPLHQSQAVLDSIQDQGAQIPDLATVLPPHLVMGSVDLKQSNHDFTRS